MQVIVVGCGRLGAELAHRLFKRGHDVTVIDQVVAAFDNLNPLFRGRTVEGEVLNQDVLHRAGIEHAEALAAVTNSDLFVFPAGVLTISPAQLANAAVGAPYRQALASGGIAPITLSSLSVARPPERGE